MTSLTALLSLPPSFLKRAESLIHLEFWKIKNFLFLKHPIVDNFKLELELINALCYILSSESTLRITPKSKLVVNTSHLGNMPTNLMGRDKRRKLRV